ncbi:MAG: hypothetical protein Q9219_005812 [cf. Caloplaca sp. 3 TL-2023]
MAPQPSAKTPRAGLSLYANLLGSEEAQSAGPGTIPRAPGEFKQSEGGAGGHDDDVSAQRQQPNAASLRFQPTKRPQPSTPRIKVKPAVQRNDPIDSGSQGPKGTLAGQPTVTDRLPAKSSLSDWAADPEDDDMHDLYPSEKRQRGGRKKRKKNKDPLIVPNWDDIYDPSRPNAYEEYQNSDEKLLEIREWKDRLYAHRFARKYTGSTSGSITKAYFGPSFAPPAEFGRIDLAARHTDNVAGEACFRRLNTSSVTEIPIPKDVPAILERPFATPMKPSGPSSTLGSPALTNRTAQSFVPSIAKSPVRYNIPAPPPETAHSEAEIANVICEEEVNPGGSDTDVVLRSSRPGQKGFAERLMSKYGWTKGSGLGASGTGIVNPLRVQVEKQKKKPDSEGGGYVGPGGRGRIIGGKRAEASASKAESGKFGVMSEVIVLHGMLNGLNLDIEIKQAVDGGLLQEIGDECGEKVSARHRG